jgi:hypothetical protein
MRNDELRAELLEYTYWLLKDEIGEGREEQIVDTYIRENW